MELTYSDLTGEIKRLGGPELFRGDHRVVLAPGGTVAGRIRVVVSLQADPPKVLTPMRTRRLLNRIKDRLQMKLRCTLQANSGTTFNLFVEEA